MKVLVIGSGGREHAICWKLAQSEDVSEVLCLPGNYGIDLEDKCRAVTLEGLDLESERGLERVCEFARSEGVDLTVVGPENPLVAGIVDVFKAAGMKIIGPDKAAAQLEGSKSFAKEFMKRYGVRTPYSERFIDFEKAMESIRTRSEFPVVIKADGLAAGKGVYICGSADEAQHALDDMMNGKKFGDAGNVILVEEFIDGKEISVLTLTDSETMIPFISSKDHKRLLEGDKGPNTGGMGVVSPNPVMTEELRADFVDNCLNPTLEGIKAEAFDFRGIIFFGLIIKDNRCYVLEYNVRMGDPETQSVLPLMTSDFLELLLDTEAKTLGDKSVEWEEGCCVNVVMASGGYPEKYVKGYEISGFDTASVRENGKVFFAGVASDSDSKAITSGGRVLSVSSTGKNYTEASEKAYRCISEISFKGAVYRRDIS
ncbi:MAG TPA: phosphoribosylamine--glycine ligase [Thermotogota bacterium]|nr:phosphoribosylamine--glycine ligase [Thermotogota bacterium]HPJ88962.1 phosphoribosylamine--glycine ligase [Thermotogota bacterium]HPR95900.1 phosphoribosylamine--glycine ligase [Thermotogota bacterium]